MPCHSIYIRSNIEKVERPVSFFSLSQTNALPLQNLLFLLKLSEKLRITLKFLYGELCISAKNSREKCREKCYKGSWERLPRFHIDDRLQLSAQARRVHTVTRKSCRKEMKDEQVPTDYARSCGKAWDYAWVRRWMCCCAAEYCRQGHAFQETTSSPISSPCHLPKASASSHDGFRRLLAATTISS